MGEYKLDRGAFQAHTLKEAANQARAYRKLSWKERLDIAAYLISVAYNFDIHNPPRMDRSKFIAKSIHS